MIGLRVSGWEGIESLVFVRHAMPQVDALSPPGEWRLAPEGVRAARGVVLPVSESTRLLASTEVKAIQTLSLITGSTETTILSDAGFDEVQRSEPVDAEYLDRRRAWVRGEPDARHEGWESFADVGARMDAAIVRLRADSMIIGTHGMALTAWLVRAGLVAPGAAAVGFWSSLAYPHVIEVTHRGGTGWRLMRTRP